MKFFFLFNSNTHKKDDFWLRLFLQLKKTSFALAFCFDVVLILIWLFYNAHTLTNIFFCDLILVVFIGPTKKKYRILYYIILCSHKNCLISLISMVFCLIVSLIRLSFSFCMWFSFFFQFMKQKDNKNTIYIMDYYYCYVRRGRRTSHFTCILFLSFFLSCIFVQWS